MESGKAGGDIAGFSCNDIPSTEIQKLSPIIPFYLIRYMGERKAWTREQDSVLLEIIQVRNIKKWSSVSRVMETQYKIFGRTGKQCRERWHNQLDPTINNNEWALEQEKILFQNHAKFGNKWARISQELEGRTDNCVKNHFYSTLRRAFKRLNRFIIDHKSKYNLKELKPVILTKLIAVFSDKFNKNLRLPGSVIDQSSKIKNKLLLISKIEDDTPENSIEMETAIREIFQFSKSYKRKKSKKARDVSDESEERYQDQLIISVKDDSEPNPDSVGQPEIILTLQRQEPQHTNLFAFTPCQIVSQQKEDSQAKESFGAFDLARRSSSKIVSDDGPEQLLMLKKGSGYSSWSMNMKQLPLRERISQLSFHRSNSDIVEFAEPPNSVINLFGCDVQQLNNR